MDIEKKFIQLTNHTYPHGNEHKIFGMLPRKLKSDEFGNLFIKIGKSDVMFTSHLDTATSVNCFVNHVIEEENGIRMIKTDGKSILGADDKSGVVIMLYMIEKKVPGLYYFFLGEEVGCIGSKKVATKHSTDPIDGITKVVSFDRRGTDSVITYQTNGRCCSDEFGEALSKELNRTESSFKYKIDPTGIYTDSAQFTKIYPECTNISVGYYSEHTFRERQDIEHLEKLAVACTKINWTSLPVSRDKTATEYKSYSSYGRQYGRWGEYDEDWYGDYPVRKVSLPEDKKEWFHDDKFRFVSDYVLDGVTKKYKSVNISPERRSMEVNLISKLFDDLKLDYSTFSWDGVKLTVSYFDKEDTIATREDMIDFFDEFDLSKLSENL